MKKMRLFGLVSFLGLTAVMGLPASYADGVSVIDDRGEVVTVEKSDRIASVSYFAADTALALGIKPVASTYMLEDRDPDFLLGLVADAKKLGQRASPNLELLADAKPDLIVALRRYTEANSDSFEAIAPFVAFSLETYADSDRSIQQLGTLLGKGKEARALNAKFAQDLAAHVEKAPTEEKPSFLFIWGGGEAPWAFYNENMSAAIATALGGKNIAGGNPTPHVPDNTAFEMSLEAILAGNPDVIFVYDYGPDRPFEANPIWSQLNAVKNDRVIYVKDHWVEAHGPIARQAVLAEAAHYLYPNSFPKPDVRQIAAGIIPSEIQ